MGSFFALFDDIATLLDDAAAMSKVATQKTSAILGDDLAVNARKASDFASSRELPVLWAIGMGSLLNKIIILPVAFLLSAFAPWAIIPILLIGGAYLAFEGAEKILSVFHKHEDHKEKDDLPETATKEEILAREKEKIHSAIVTDFILSIEIVVIALSTVQAQGLPVQIIAVTAVALIATVGVYGIVALIVRMDDMGFKIIEIASGAGKNRGVTIGELPLLRRLGVYAGKSLVVSLPVIIRVLTVLGTLAMLLVAGGIFSHNVQLLHHLLETTEHALPLPRMLTALLFELVLGLVIGLIVVAFIELGKKLFRKPSAH